MKAYVLSHKGVLISNPDVQKMTPARWLFEYHALKEKEVNQYKYMKTLLVNLLGLNLVRPEDNGVPKDASQLTDEEKESFIPLSMWMGHETMLQKVSEQFERLHVDEKATSDKDYERLVEQIDLAGGDMEPILSEMFGQVDEEALKKKTREEVVEKLKIPKASSFDVDVDI